MYSSSHCCKLVKYSSKLFVWCEDYMQAATLNCPKTECKLFVWCEDYMQAATLNRPKTELQSCPLV